MRVVRLREETHRGISHPRTLDMVSPAVHAALLLLLALAPLGGEGQRLAVEATDFAGRLEVNNTCISPALASPCSALFSSPFLYGVHPCKKEEALFPPVVFWSSCGRG